MDYIKKEYNMFLSNEMTLTDIYYPVLEAFDNVTSVDDDSNKSNFGRKLLDKVNLLIKELLAIIERYFDNIWQFIKRIAQTDVGFKDNIRKAIREQKPLEAVKLVAYQYNDNFLESQMSKLTNVIFSLASNLKTRFSDVKDSENSVMSLPTRDLYAHILNTIGCPKEVTDINFYYQYLKKEYRNKKVEMLFKSSETRTYYNIALSREKLEGVVKAKQQTLKSQVSTIKANLSNITLNAHTPNDVKQKALKQYSNVSHLYNFYCSFLKIYLQLKIEQNLSYRAVLKKLYHIK